MRYKKKAISSYRIPARLASTRCAAPPSSSVVVVVRFPASSSSSSSSCSPTWNSGIPKRNCRARLSPRRCRPRRCASSKTSEQKTLLSWTSSSSFPGGTFGKAAHYYLWTTTTRASPGEEDARFLRWCCCCLTSSYVSRVVPKESEGKTPRVFRRRRQKKLNLGFQIPEFSIHLTFITKDILFITLQKYYYLLYFVGWKRR